ncbi:NADH dehydrogenase [ubiquinone] 1 alpha subcomplex assembly factor 4 [Brachionichthys hirsutus]|uniref:NADH dehydrogenase [ubiquinone] 1 alpha subcomplex assembly factor 4 n=1 Tax=Brachionichthys hirsutus TaxID=412623 RepID=UPI003604C723
MGARLARVFRNFNLENRVEQEITKQKPLPAPRHAVRAPPPAGSSGSDAVDTVNRRNDSLLGLLKSVYVDSTDPAAAEESKAAIASKDVERRPLKFSMPGNVPGLAEVTDVPKGSLTIVEALKALSSHQQQPQTCTPEKIAHDYSLGLKDAEAILEFFIPFHVHVLPAKTQKANQIKAS